MVQNTNKENPRKHSQEQYFTKHPTSSPSPDSFSCTVQGVRCMFQSSAGVFSKSRLDPASSLLVEASLLELKSRGVKASLSKVAFLDLGCGIGTVGIFAKRSFLGSLLDVTFSDVNERALALARRNIKWNGINGVDRESCHVIFSDGFSNPSLAEARFDVIAFNPPQHAGKELCNRLIREAVEHLSQGGALLVVARHNRGGSSFCIVMEEAVGNAQTFLKQGIFRVYRAVHA